MAAYTKQTWDTTSVFNPTRMNHMEQGIYDASTNIVDNLTSTDATKALSAKQGKALNDKIELVEIKEKTVSITTSNNDYVSPFTKAAVINYDNEITRDSFISATSNLTASYIVMAYPSYIVFACNTAGTYDLTIKYSKGVHIIT